MIWNYWRDDLQILNNLLVMYGGCHYRKVMFSRETKFDSKEVGEDRRRQISFFEKFGSLGGIGSGMCTSDRYSTYGAGHTFPTVFGQCWVGFGSRYHVSIARSL